MNKPFLLVVEDDHAVRNLITTTLETQDYKYHTAVNGNQALMEAVSQHPDIILLDLGLPDIDGDQGFSASQGSDPALQIRNRRHCRCKEKSFRLFSEGLKPGSMPECWFYLWLQVNDLLREDNQN